MRVLHVAALPFPSPQGTQGLLRAMLEAHVEARDEAHLLCYPQGEPITAAFAIHRAGGASIPASFRSGPSFSKLALDAALALSLRASKLQPELVIAHHVEAALIASLLRVPAVFCAHTDLGAELPSYFAPRWRLPLRFAGSLVDALLVRHMRTWAVSPLLARRLGRAEVVPVPWRVPPAITPQERKEAREKLGYSEGARVALYAGNLDAYQGLDVLTRAIVRMPALHWLIATASPLADFVHRIRKSGLRGRVRFVRLEDEVSRRRVHAACDVALVPREVPGGVPIKLFDALARGVPTVAARTALAGYPLHGVCSVVDEDWERAIEHALNADPARGRAYIAEAHDPQRYARYVRELSGPSLRDAARA